MKKVYIFLLFVITFGAAQAHDVSKNSYFSVLTCEPGNEVYAHFGHTAIRFVDTTNNIDLVFNYGLFSYSEDFVYNFVKGETYYTLGVQSFSNFISEYYMDNRCVLEQKLNLSLFQKQEVFNFLEWNYKPENRKYLYNFYYDNCSSRPRDIIQRVFGDSVLWDSKSIAHTDTLWLHKTAAYYATDYEKRTWRDFINMYTPTNTWLSFGMNLGLGLHSDNHISKFQSMFLPDCLFLMIEGATIKRNGSVEPLALQTHYLYKAATNTKEKISFTSPAIILWFLCLLFLAIAYIEVKKQKHIYWLDVTLYFMVGLIGVFVWYVSLFSIHPTVFPNFNLIWVTPFHVLFACLWIIPKLRKYTQWYLIIYTVIFGLYILTSPINPQYVHIGYIAIMVILGSRYLSLYKKAVK